MVNQQLLDYIKQQTALGKSKEEITASLLAAGWPAQDVEQAFLKPTSPAGVPMPTMSEIPKARQILSEAWAIYKNRFKTLIAVSLIPLLGYFILGFVGGGGIVVLEKYFHITVSGFGILILIILGLIVLIGIVYVSIWGSVATLFAIKDSAESIGWKESFKRAKPYINPFFSTGLLCGLAVMGGFILLIIPGIIFGLWFSQYPYVVIEEGSSNSAALKRSKYYVKGRMGTVFGKLFYMGIITIGISIVIGIILGIINTVSGLKPEDTSWAQSVFSLFWTPLATVYGYQLYKYLRTSRP